MEDKFLWGHGENITASQRRGNTAPEAMNDTGDNSSDDENLFDIIGRELDEREEEARRELQQQQQQQQQQQCQQEHNDGTDDNSTAVFSQSGHDDEVDFLPMQNDWTASDGDGDGDGDGNGNRINDYSALDETDATVPRTISKRRREYSVVKSTTPRFSFQSSVKSASTSRHSISPPLLSPKSDKQPPKKSVKRKHRHSFHQSMDRKESKSTASITQVNNNMRELGFAPKFLANARPASFSNEDAIGEGDDDDDALGKRKWNRLTSSQAAITSPKKQSSSSRRNKTGGYLIQCLRSLRNNDQRMAMRLRASTAPMSSKRRRSSGGSTGSRMNLLASKQVAASELDVTVMMDVAVPNHNDDFGIGKIRLAYIHRYTGAMGCQAVPCYSWIVLPQHVLDEKSIGDTGGASSKQLRCYDAIIIPPRIASISAEGQLIPLNGLKETELPLPTIICASVCEQCTSDTTTSLHDVSFDKLCKY